MQKYLFVQFNQIVMDREFCNVNRVNSRNNEYVDASHVVGKANVDQYFLNIARDYAHKSPCISGRVGAIVVKNKIVVATGVKGVVNGKTCVELGVCEKYDEGKTGICIGEHAEKRAVKDLLSKDVKCKNLSMYIYGYKIKWKRECLVDVVPTQETLELLKKNNFTKVFYMTEEGKMKKINVY